MKSKSGKETNMIPWESISAYLDDNQKTEHKDLLSAWLKASPDNVDIFNEILNTQLVTKKIPEFYTPNQELLWKKLMFKIGVENNERSSWRPIIKWLAAAVVIISVFISGHLTGIRQQTPSKELHFCNVTAPSGSRSLVTLPDSTSVWLNSGAQIRYPVNFGIKSRDVYISGECYFEVTKNQKQAFIVHGSQVKVKVYGTKFNIKENSINSNTEVALLEGSVAVLDRSNKEMALLSPGDQYVSDGISGQVHQPNNLNAILCWKNDYLLFEDQPLKDVVHQLESWYGVQIDLDSAMLNKHNYSFKVKTESLREILELMSFITPIDYQIDGKTVQIEYKK